MKKNGKKFRRLQKEEAERKANIVVGDGSKRREREARRIERENQEIHTCYHYYREQKEISREEILNFPLEDVRYEWMHYFFYGIKEHYYHCRKQSYLHKISSSECKCINCGQVFPIQKIKQMEEMFDYMNHIMVLQSKLPEKRVENADSELDYADFIIQRNANIFNIRLFDDNFLTLCEGIEPVRYRGIHNPTKEILEVCKKTEEWEEYKDVRVT